MKNIILFTESEMKNITRWVYKKIYTILKRKIRIKSGCQDLMPFLHSYICLMRPRIMVLILRQPMI